MEAPRPTDLFCEGGRNMAESGQFEVKEIDLAKGSAIIVLEGELDYSIYTTFKRGINDLIEKGVRQVTYDLSKLTYIQSLGLGIIMWSYVELDSRGGKVAISGANEKIKQVFAAAQLDTLVTIH
jgi:anti-sigma B factor antagonist